MTGLCLYISLWANPITVRHGHFLLHHNFTSFYSWFVDFICSCTNVYCVHWEMMLSDLLQQAQWENIEFKCTLQWFDWSIVDIAAAGLPVCLFWQRKARANHTSGPAKRSDCFVCKWIRINACRGLWNANGLDYSTQKPRSDETTCGPVNRFAAMAVCVCISLQ